MRAVGDRCCRKVVDELHSIDVAGLQFVLDSSFRSQNSVIVTVKSCEVRLL